MTCRASLASSRSTDGSSRPTLNTPGVSSPAADRITSSISQPSVARRSGRSQRAAAFRYVLPPPTFRRERLTTGSVGGCTSTSAHGWIGADEVHGVLGIESVMARTTANEFLAKDARGAVPAGGFDAGSQFDHGPAVRLEHVNLPNGDAQAVEELEYGNNRGLLVGVRREITHGLDDVALALERPGRRAQRRLF